MTDDAVVEDFLRDLLSVTATGGSVTFTYERINKLFPSVSALSDFCDRMGLTWEVYLNKKGYTIKPHPYNRELAGY